MPGLVMTLLGALVQGAASLTGRVLLALGIGFVAYQGIDVVISSLLSDVQAYMGGLNGVVLQVLGVCQVDTAIQMLFSAMTARLVISGLTSGVVKRMIVK